MYPEEGFGVFNFAGLGVFLCLVMRHLAFVVFSHDLSLSLFFAFRGHRFAQPSNEPEKAVFKSSNGCSGSRSSTGC
jgi:hypothetical protein